MAPAPAVCQCMSQGRTSECMSDSRIAVCAAHRPGAHHPRSWRTHWHFQSSQKTGSWPKSVEGQKADLRQRMLHVPIPPPPDIHLAGCDVIATSSHCPQQSVGVNTIDVPHKRRVDRISDQFAGAFGQFFGPFSRNGQAHVFELPHPSDTILRGDD